MLSWNPLPFSRCCVPSPSPLQEALLAATLAKDALAVQRLRGQVTQADHDALKAWATGRDGGASTVEADQFAHLTWTAQSPHAGWTTDDPWTRSSFGSRKVALQWIRETWHEQARREMLFTYLDKRDFPGLAAWAHEGALAPFEALHGIRLILGESGPLWTPAIREQALAVLVPLATPTDLVNTLHDTTVSLLDEPSERVFFEVAHQHTTRGQWVNAVGSLMHHAALNLNGPSFDRLLEATARLPKVQQARVRALWADALADLSHLDQTAGMTWLIERAQVAPAAAVARLLTQWAQRAKDEGREDPSVRHDLTRVDRLGAMAAPLALGRIRQMALNHGVWDELPTTQGKWHAMRRQRQTEALPPPEPAARPRSRYRS